MWKCVVVLLLAAVAHASVVHTQCGDISGGTYPNPYNLSAVDLYMSVPFAAPPLGQLRFRPPQPAPCPWNGTLDGTKIPAVCTHTNGEGSEDCLYMNIMVPPNAHNLPVMVYFHGGNLVGGSAPSEISNAAAIAVLGKMVTVTVAYRLNVLGWLATDDLAQEQGGYAGNYGTQDAIMALQWINQNIAAFGGDPNHVVLTGQSSGGTLIFSLMAAPAAQGLFTAAYSMSGSPNMTQDASAKFAFDSTIVASVGCGNSSWTSAQRMACLRDLPASTLSKATPGPWGTPGIFGWYMPQGLPSPSVGGDNYAGIVYVDGNTVVLPFDQALIAGVNGNATLVISNMAAESDRGPGVNTLHLKGVGEWQSAVRDALAKWGPDANSTADTLSSMYLTEAKIEAQLAYDTMISDYGLTCAGYEIAMRMQQSDKRVAPVYLMYNAYVTTHLRPQDNTTVWPYHGLDWRDLGVDWDDFTPQPVDWYINQQLVQLVVDLANGGTLPDSWNWQPAFPSPTSDINTHVFARTDIWPFGGIRDEVNWSVDKCLTMQKFGIDQQYWWCD